MVTKLQAVNASLLAIGQQLVATLDDALDIDATQALILLDEINEEIQSEGWAFNTDENVVLTPNSQTGKIAIPTNYINVRSIGTPTVQVRNGKLYNQSTQTDVFTSNVTAEVVRLVPYEEAPAPFALYVKSLLVRPRTLLGRLHNDTNACIRRTTGVIALKELGQQYRAV
jgi:hypothetical protein